MTRSPAMDRILSVDVGFRGLGFRGLGLRI